ncbi:MAG TPA: ankyrin repeat domain-containing protein, partial [Chthonomonadales bacterium]|nr:ankyrin repeat domain-containing protein [Chthonomonadales bacterium]
SIKLLLDHGSHTEGRDINGKTPLILGCELGDFQAAKLLLDYGAKIECKDRLRQTPLLAAVFRFGGALSVPGINASASPGAVIVRTAEERMALIHLLLARRANPNVSLWNGSVPLEIAAGMDPHYSLAMMKLLTSFGAHFGDRCGSEGSALATACGAGSLAVAKYLLHRGADPNARGWPIPQTALCAAAAGGRDAIVSLLLSRGASLSLTDTPGGSSALMDAVGAGRLSTARLLLKLGANVNYRTQNGETPLSAARDPGICAVLLSAGAKPAR